MLPLPLTLILPPKNITPSPPHTRTTLNTLLTEVLEGAPPARFKAALEGRAVARAGRKGKQLWLSFSGGGGEGGGGEGEPVHLLVHLGMDGELLVRGPDGTMLRGYKYRAQLKGAHQDAFPPSHCKILLEFEDGTALAFDEWRRFGRCRLVEGGAAEACGAVAKLGFDAYAELPPLAEFEALLRRRARAKLKAVLLDQGFCAGIGNWVADEVLYQVGVCLGGCWVGVGGGGVGGGVGWGGGCVGRVELAGCCGHTLQQPSPSSDADAASPAAHHLVRAHCFLLCVPGAPAPRAGRRRHGRRTRRRAARGDARGARPRRRGARGRGPVPGLVDVQPQVDRAPGGRDRGAAL